MLIMHTSFLLLTMGANDTGPKRFIDMGLVPVVDHDLPSAKSSIDQDERSKNSPNR